MPFFALRLEALLLFLSLVDADSTYLPDIRVHDLRHSHVSLCIELGYSIVLVAKRIGDTVPVVMRTYAHLYPNKQQELVSKLEAIGSPTSNNDDSDLMSLG